MSDHHNSPSYVYICTTPVGVHITTLRPVSYLFIRPLIAFRYHLCSFEDTAPGTVRDMTSMFVGLLCTRCMTPARVVYRRDATRRDVTQLPYRHIADAHCSSLHCYVPYLYIYTYIYTYSTAPTTAAMS